jgi:hypothetical protein
MSTAVGTTARRRIRKTTGGTTVMAEDKHRAIRDLPFASLAGELGIDLSRSGSGTAGLSGQARAPRTRRRRRDSVFVLAGGKFNCFSCRAKGRGAIDVAMAASGIGFQGGGQPRRVRSRARTTITTTATAIARSTRRASPIGAPLSADHTRSFQAAPVAGCKGARESDPEPLRRRPLLERQPLVRVQRLRIAQMTTGASVRLTSVAQAHPLLAASSSVV